MQGLKTLATLPDCRRSIAVGNEPFLADYGGAYDGLVVPALQNLYQALQDMNLDSRIKLTVPLNLDILAVSYPPSAAVLRPDVAPQVSGHITRQCCHEHAVNAEDNAHPPH